MSRVRTDLSALWARDGIRSVLGILSTNLTILVINMGTGVLTARWLGPAGRGELTAICMWPQFLAYALAFGIPTALTYRLRREPENANAFLGAAIVLSFLLGFIAAAVGIVGLPHVLSSYPAPVVRVAQFVMLTAPLFLLGVVMSGALLSWQSLLLYNWTKLAGPTFAMALLCALIFIGHMNSISAALIYVFSIVLVAIWSTVLCARTVKPRFSSLFRPMKSLISYGARYCGNDLAGTIGTQLDRVIVVGVLNPADLGFYMIGLNLSRVISQLQIAVATALFPKASALPPQRAWALCMRAAAVSGALTIFAAIPLFIVGPMLISLVYGSSFVPATLVFRILLIEASLSGTIYVLLQAFNATGRPGMASVVQVIGLAASLPLLVLFVPRFGVAGAAAAILVATIARFVYVAVVLLRTRTGGDWAQATRPGSNG